MKQTNSTNLIKDSIFKTLKYYDFFDFPVTQEEIHRYLGIQTTKKEVSQVLQDLLRKRLVDFNIQNGLYALRGHGKRSIDRAARKGYSDQKRQKINKYLVLLKLFPWFSLIGLSGSCAIDNAKKTDDIDLFIISTPGRMWTSRFTAVSIAKLLRMHRSRNSTAMMNKVCLNLFYDGLNVKVPQHKQNTYIAHEIVQMRPLYARKGAYSLFMRENAWYRTFLPNVPLPVSAPVHDMRVPLLSLFMDGVEAILKRYQLWIMKTPTREILSDAQLWFFPNDFENKLKKKVEIKKVSSR